MISSSRVYFYLEGNLNLISLTHSLLTPSVFLSGFGRDKTSVFVEFGMTNMTNTKFDSLRENFFSTWPGGDLEDSFS